MLHGVRPDEQRRLARSGERVRVYVPYGDEWYGYLVRRLAGVLPTWHCSLAHSSRRARGMTARVHKTVAILGAGVMRETLLSVFSEAGRAPATSSSPSGEPTVRPSCTSATAFRFSTTSLP